MEAWLLGDREGMDTFFGIEAGNVPERPEEVANPKRELVNLSRRSRFKRIREGMVPAAGSTASVGPEYGGLVAEFSIARWNWQAAADACDSLRRLIAAVRKF
jgi:hypothetical protein